MTDIVDNRTRSRMMSSIRAKNTKPELIVRHYLHSKGFRYRLHYAKLPGRPDIVMHKYNLAIFVNGCFWHRHQSCKYTTNPEQNREKWQKKFKQNIERDQKQIKQLLDLGWRVLIIWECGLKKYNTDLSSLIDHIRMERMCYAEWPSRL